MRPNLVQYLPFVKSLKVRILKKKKVTFVLLSIFIICQPLIGFRAVGKRPGRKKKGRKKGGKE
jgi:hypothetical protein